MMSRRNNSSSSTGNNNGRGRSAATASNNAAIASSALSSHPAEYNPEHISFLQRSLDRNDADIAAVVELNRTLRTLRELIIEHCSELTLLDLGEGILRLAPDDGTGNSEQIVHLTNRNNKNDDNRATDTENKDSQTTPKSKLSFSPKLTTSSHKKPIGTTSTALSPLKEVSETGVRSTPSKQDPTTPVREVSELNTTACKTPDDNKSSTPLYYEPYYFESHYQEELCIDFCLRLKLRRKLLSRIVRRLLRIATAMDGTDVSPPPIPVSKYGDIRLNIDDKLVAELMEQITRQQQTMLKITRRKELEYENSIRAREPGGLSSEGTYINSNLTDRPDNAASPSNVLSSHLLQEADDQIKSSPLSKKKSEPQVDSGSLNNNDDKFSRQFPIKKRTYDSSTQIPDETRSESFSDCEENGNNREQNLGSTNYEHVLAEEIDQFYRKRRKLQRDDDYDSWKDYKDIYEKEMDPVSGKVLCYTIQKQDEQDALKQNGGTRGMGTVTAPVTSGNGMNKNTKSLEGDAEWYRYKESLIARIPIQPTYAELGMEYSVFYGKERRKRALEKLNQEKEKGQFQVIETSNKSSERYNNSDNEDDLEMEIASSDRGNQNLSIRKDIDDENTAYAIPTAKDGHFFTDKKSKSNDDTNSDDGIINDEKNNELNLRERSDLSNDGCDAMEQPGKEFDIDDVAESSSKSELRAENDNSVSDTARSQNGNLVFKRNEEAFEIDEDNTRTNMNFREPATRRSSKTLNNSGDSRENNVTINENGAFDQNKIADNNESSIFSENDEIEDSKKEKMQPRKSKSGDAHNDEPSVVDNVEIKGFCDDGFLENRDESGVKGARVANGPEVNNMNKNEDGQQKVSQPKVTNLNSDPNIANVHMDASKNIYFDAKNVQVAETPKDGCQIHEEGVEKSEIDKEPKNSRLNGKTKRKSRSLDCGDDRNRKIFEAPTGEILDERNAGNDDNENDDSDNPEKQSPNKPVLAGGKSDQGNDTIKDVIAGVQKIRPISLVPIPSFYEQDMKRIKLIHSDLVNASMQTYARKKLEDCTKNYNAALKNSNEIYDRRQKLQNRLSNLTVELRHQQAKSLEYASKVNIERNRWNKRRFQFEQNRNNLLLPSRHGAYSQGTPYIQHYASRLDHTGIAHQVGQCLADIVDVVHNVATGRLRLERFNERFIPPPDPFGIDQNTGESLMLIKQRMDKELRHEIDQLTVKLKSSEDNRSHAWRKMLKMKSEYGILHDVSISGPPRFVKIDANNPTASIPLPELRQSTTQNLVEGNHQPPASSTGNRSFTPAARRAVNTPRPLASTPTKNPSSSQTLPGSVAESKYSAARVKERKASDGTVKPVEQPKIKDGLFLRPAGRTRKGMEWDAVRGIWIPAPGLNSSIDEED